MFPSAIKTIVQETVEEKIFSFKNRFFFFKMWLNPLEKNYCIVFYYAHTWHNYCLKSFTKFYIKNGPNSLTFTVLVKF